MKTTKIVILAALVISLSAPLVAEASWWNPFSWFRKAVIEKVQVPAQKDGAVEQKKEEKKKPTTSPVSGLVLPKGTVKVTLGEVYTAQGASAVVTEVVEDSRCPTGVQCIQAGTVRVRVKGTYGAFSQSTIMTLGKPLQFKGYSATLVDVTPKPTSSVASDSSEWAFYFSFKTPTGDTVIPKEEDSYQMQVAQCLKKQGAQLFGASWCPHCIAQKVLFGTAAKFLPYVECSSDRQQFQQNQICIDNGISAYPTWKFKDGTVLTGEQSMDALVAAGQCTSLKL